MNYKLFSLVSIAIGLVVLGLVVLLKNPKSETNRTFAAFTSCIIGWMVSLHLFYETTDLLHALFWGRAVFAVTFFTGLFLVLFSAAFPKARFKDISLVKKTVMIISVGILSTLSLSTDLILAKVEFHSYGTNFSPGPLYPIFIVYMVSCSMATFLVLFLKYRKSSGVAREQLKYLFLGFFVSGVFTLWTNLFWPLISGQNQLSQYGPYSMAILLGFTSYAIVKHRLMDIKLVVVKSAIYSVLLSIVCGIFISLVYYMQTVYAETHLINPYILFAAAGFVVAFGFQPMRRFLEKATDRIFFKDRYNPQELLGRFSEFLGSTILLDPLADFVLRVLKEEVRIEKVALILLNKEDQVADIRQGGFEITDFFAEEIIHLSKEVKSLVAEEFEEEIKEGEFLRKLNISVLLPLKVEGRLEGILVLGNKRSGDMFAVQDIKFLEVLVPEVAIAIKNALLFEERNKRVRELSALNKLAFSLGTGLELKSILNQAIEQAILVTDADSGSIMLLDEENQTLSIEASKGLKKEALENDKKVGKGIAGWVAEKREPLILIDGLDPRFQKELRREDIISSLAVPLKVKEKVIGVLNINRKISEEVFSRCDLELVTTFAGQVAVAIENAKLYEDLERTFLGTISALATTVDAKDHYTYGHSRNVTDLAVATAKELSMSPSQIDKIRIAATLHDIGKIGIDGSILNKPGKLNPEERKIINDHPTIAANILESLEFLKDIVPMILFHHERFDGKGYPSGIAAHAIPLGARIIAVADSFNAMVSDRPYRPALSQEKARQELRDNAGTQFDPQVVEAFLKVLSKTSFPDRMSKPSWQRDAVFSK